MNARCPKCKETADITPMCGDCAAELVFDTPEFCQAHATAGARLHALIDEAVGKFPRTAGHGLEERLADLVKTYKEVVADLVFATERELEAYRALIAQADEIRSKFVGPLRPERARLDAIAAVREVDDLEPDTKLAEPAPVTLKVGDTVHLTEAVARQYMSRYGQNQGAPGLTSVGRVEMTHTVDGQVSVCWQWPGIGCWRHKPSDLLPGEPPTRRDDPRVVAAVERAKQGDDVPYVERRRPEAIGRTIPIHGQEIPIHDLPMDQHPHECNCGCHACPECCLSLRKGVVCGWCRVPAR